MKIAIVILNWNGENLLEKFLPSVVLYSKDADIYIIDNNSSDNSINFISNNFPKIKIIKNKHNFGFAKGYNEGLKYIEADVFCLLNSDVEVTENWLNPIINLYQADENIAVIQPKILSYNNKHKFEYAGAAGGFIDYFGYPYCRGRVFEKIEEDKNQYNDEIEIFWASGCAFFIKKEVFWSLNGFDETFFAHQEEIDLCWRVKNTGKKIFYTYKSVVYHLGGATLNKNNTKKTYLNFRNNLLMLLKNLPSYKLFPIIFIRLVLDGIAGIYLLKNLGFNHVLAVIKAHLSFYRFFITSFKKRQKKQILKYYTKFSIFN